MCGSGRLGSHVFVQAGLAEVQMSNHGPYIGPLLGRQLVCCIALVDGLGTVFGTKQEYLTCQVQTPILFSRPELRQDYPLNLSISLSGGKETNKDSPSNGERTGNSPT